MFIESEYINICLLGCVSAGKSTILDSLFTRDYAQFKIKRTTMVPCKFLESDTEQMSESYIYETICDKNNEIVNKTENDEINENNYEEELVFNVERINISTSHKICMYDIPGLNDAKTKKIYYNYLEKVFHKFNIVLFIIDVNSGLNTSDECDILEAIMRNIKKHEMNKTIQMICVVNKCDDMVLNTENGLLEPIDEYAEMYEQINKTVLSYYEKYNVEGNIIIIPICGLDAHLYRMIQKDKQYKLSQTYINKIGTSQEGSRFKCLTKQEKEDRIKDIIANDDFVNQMIMMSGFSRLEERIKNIIDIRGNMMIIENKTWKLTQLDSMNISNLHHIFTQSIQIINTCRQYCELTYRDKIIEYVKKMYDVVKSKILKINKISRLIKTYNKHVVKKCYNTQIDKEIVDFSITPPFLRKRMYDCLINDISYDVVFFKTIQKLHDYQVFQTFPMNNVVANLFGKKLEKCDFASVYSILETIKRNLIFEEKRDSFIKLTATFVLNIDNISIFDKMLLSKCGENYVIHGLSNVNIFEIDDIGNEDVAYHCSGYVLYHIVNSWKMQGEKYFKLQNLEMLDQYMNVVSNALEILCTKITVEEEEDFSQETICDGDY